MRYLLLILILVCLSGARPTERHTLLWWTEAQVVESWYLEQCTNVKVGCTDWRPLASFSATTLETSVTIPKNSSACWRIRPEAQGYTYSFSEKACI